MKTPNNENELSDEKSSDSPSCSPPEGYEPYCIPEDLPVWELVNKVEGNAPLKKTDGHA